MKAAEIMTTEVAKIKGSETVAKAVQLMREKNIRTLIVDRRHDGGRPCGRQTGDGIEGRQPHPWLPADRGEVAGHIKQPARQLNGPHLVIR